VLSCILPSIEFIQLTRVITDLADSCRVDAGHTSPEHITPDVFPSQATAKPQRDEHMPGGKRNFKLARNIFKVTCAKVPRALKALAGLVRAGQQAKSPSYPAPSSTEASAESKVPPKKSTSVSILLQTEKPRELPTLVATTATLPDRNHDRGTSRQLDEVQHLHNKPPLISLVTVCLGSENPDCLIIATNSNDLLLPSPPFTLFLRFPGITKHNNTGLSRILVFILLFHIVASVAAAESNINLKGGLTVGSAALSAALDVISFAGADKLPEAATLT
jgi:hypothetical protein